MPELLSPSDVETLARDRGLSVAQLCAQAGVAHSTFTRWRAGKTEPTLDVYRRFVNVIGANAPLPVEAVA